MLDKGEEEEKAWDDIFFGIKQINVHAKEDVHKGIDFYIDVGGGEDEGPEEHKNSIGDGWNPNWFHAQGGTHEETPLPGNLVVDGTARGGAEAGVFSSMR